MKPSNQQSLDRIAMVESWLACDTPQDEARLRHFVASMIAGSPKPMVIEIGKLMVEHRKELLREETEGN